MVYLPPKENSRINIPYLKNKVNAIRSNTSNYFDSIKYHEILYGLYIYGYFKISDYKLEALYLSSKIKTGNIIDTDNVIKSLIGKYDYRVSKLAYLWQKEFI